MKLDRIRDHDEIMEQLEVSIINQYYDEVEKAIRKHECLRVVGFLPSLLQNLKYEEDFAWYFWTEILGVTEDHFYIMANDKKQIERIVKEEYEKIFETYHGSED